MKFLFLETRYDEKVELPNEVIEKLPKKIALFFTLQFLDSLAIIKKQIEATGRTVIVTKGKHTKYIGQIYGCNLEKFPGDAFLYIGDGLFHPKALALTSNKEVHIWNPIQNKPYFYGLAKSKQSHQRSNIVKAITKNRYVWEESSIFYCLRKSSHRNRQLAHFLFLLRDHQEA